MLPPQASLAEAGEAHLFMWAKEDVTRELLHSVAIAVQRGGALSYLHGYEQTLRALRIAREAKVARNTVKRQRREEVLVDEDESEERDEEEEEAASAT